MSDRDAYLADLRRLSSLLTEDLKEEVTVVGGTAPSLYSEVDKVGLRPTTDIDLTLQATTATAWQRRARSFEDCGFRAVSDGPICRYRRDDLTIDIIPSDPSALGFRQSRWYSKVSENRTYIREVGLHVVTPTLFVALKIEAHLDRGAALPHPNSKDLEDIVVVLANVEGLIERISSRSEEVERYIDDHLGGIFRGDPGLERFQMYFPGDASTQQLAQLLHEKMSINW